MPLHTLAAQTTRGRREWLCRTEVRPTSDEPKEWLGLTPRRRHEVEREFIANALYLGIVLYVTLAVIPPDDLPSDHDLVLLIIGTGAGLVLAHWFAFHVAASALSPKGRTHEQRDRGGRRPRWPVASPSP